MRRPLLADTNASTYAFMRVDTLTTLCDCPSCVRPRVCKLQIYFLWHRFSNQIQLEQYNKGFIQDRTIYEDKEIFARNLRDLGHLSERDWATYENLFNSMTQFIKEPDLFIYLKASTTTLISRIENRKRDFEKNISPEYIHSLNIYYEKWISKIDKDKLLIIDTNNFNIFKDTDRLDEIVFLIKEKLK